MDRLEELCPALCSVSIVPAGITKHREGLFELADYDRDSAALVLDAVERKGRECLEKHGTRLFFPSDELFLKAERTLPDEEYYEDFSQLDNGVGGCSLLRAQAGDFLLGDINAGTEPRHVSIATGEGAWSLIDGIAREVSSRFGNVSCRCYKIHNDFYGEKITVAGLITGGDLISQLTAHKHELGEELLIPEVMLRQDSEVFLDDITVSQVSQALGVKVTPCPNDGEKLVGYILGLY